MNSNNETSELVGVLTQILQKYTKVPSTLYDPSTSSAHHTTCNLTTPHSSMSNDCTWIMDSGAPDIMTNNPNCLINLNSNNKKQFVSMANRASILIRGYGEIKFMLDRQESKAFYIPEFPSNLLSIGKLTNALNMLFFLLTLGRFKTKPWGGRLVRQFFSWSLFFPSISHYYKNRNRRWETTVM